MPIEAAPIVVEPSGNFLGDDGAWSTFVVSAGSPPQSLQVLASTEVASTWVVSPDGCGTNDAPDCTTSRGGAYDVTKSSTWNSKGIFLLGAESTLGYAGPGNDVNGTYGYDTLALAGSSGAANISVDHQVIAAIITDDFFVGNLGLSNQAINMTSSADSSPSFLTSLKNQNLIPTLSYGYTAGASYQQKNGVNGSLTLGGYDASRFTHNDISFTFAPLGTRQLVVAIPSITFSNSKTQTSLLSQPIMALVDSTVPHMWLPQDACKAFEQAFGLIWDPVHSLYTVNDTAHKTLLQENPSVIFELSNSNSGPSVNITLPYASFDLTANYPLVKSQTRFFPLQRGSDNSKYTLGRTFLQESFLIVNYEHSNFSISQAVYDPSTPSHIVAIPSTSTTGTASANPTSSGSPILKTTGSGPHGSGSHSIGTGAIAGIAIAIVLIASLIGAFFITKRIRKQRSLRAELEGDEPKDTQEMSIEYALKQDISKDSNGLEAKNRNTTIEVKEVPLTPPLSEMGAEIHGFFGADCGKQPLGPLHHEMPGSPVNRSELSSPEPWSRIELPSPDPEALRSELSTPEPMYINSELPTPDPSHELPSPGMSEAFGPVSPRTDNRRSALNSPMPRLPL